MQDIDEDKTDGTAWRPRITPGSGPKYLAIADALARDIEAGRLPAGTRLPPHRILAQALGVDLTTVTRAFNEARRLGLVEGATRQGSFVRRAGTPPGGPARGMIDLSMNMPPQPHDMLLQDAIRAGMDHVLSMPGPLERLNYQDSLGSPVDRDVGAGFLALRIPGVEANRVAVAPGAQAALHAILATQVPAGATVAAPAVAYPGLRSAAAACDLDLAPVGIDRHGLLPEDLEHVCAETRPRALYCVPNIDNPTTATLPPERREAIIAIARRYDLLLIEDDPYRPLVDTPYEALAAAAPDITVHIATLSKCATPALRVAYVAMPNDIALARLAAGLRASALMAPPIMAGLASRWILDGTLARLTDAIRRESVARRALAARILAPLRYTADGYHLWLTLPSGWRPGALAAEAQRAGLAVVASEAFALGPVPDAVRISLGAAPERADLEHGLSVLARLLTGSPGQHATVV